MGAFAIRAGWFGWSGFAGRTAQTAAVGGVVALIDYQKALRASPQPAAAQFTATVAGVARGVVSVAVGGTGNTRLTVTLAAGNLTAGQVVALTYVPGATATTRLAYADGTEFGSGVTEITAA